MIDWLGGRFPWWESLLHLLLCNNALFPGCIGHREKGGSR